MNNRIYLNNGWHFTERFSERILDADFDEKEMVEVRLPHTCKETPLHYFDEHIYQMVSGYRKVIAASESWRGQRVILTIDGAAHESEVFLNGEKVGGHSCGYTAFSIDLSEKLRYGEDNVLVIKVDSRETLNIPPFGFVVDYMTYGGIYRDVYLDIKNPVYLEDVFIRSEFGKEDLKSAAAVSEITLNEKAEGLSVCQYIKKKTDAEYRLLGEEAIGSLTKTLRFQPDQVKLWSTNHPHLYEIKTQLKQNGTVVDEKIVTFGFRKAEFRADGFYLNGKKLKIRGLNRHQSYPYVGYAMPKSMQRMDADILKKELGLNAVRTSHYPQSHYFLERCDELGLLVFTEMPGWQHIGNEDWKMQAVENVRDMVRQYRNHTSIILWGVRINESRDDDGFYQKTNAAAHDLDPSRATGGVRAHKRSSLLEDVYTYNDFLHDGKTKGCDKKADVTSDVNKAYLVSEYNGHMYPTKSFDWEEHRAQHALRHANVLDAVAGEKDIAGSFGWCMFDYNTHKDFGSGDRVCYHGVMDMFRNPKLAADVYACQQEKTPVLSLSSSMDIGEHPGCNRGNTYILTNADSVRMYKNDVFIKEYTRKDSPYQHLKHGPILLDDFIGDAIEKNEDFKPAQAKGIKDALNATARYGLSNLPKSVYLTAVKMMVLYHMKPEQAVELYNRYIGDWGGASTSYRFDAVKDGKVVKSIVKEPMTSLTMEVTVNNRELTEGDTYDVAAVRVRILDEHGNQAHFYQEPMMLETEGPIMIIGPKAAALSGGMGGAYVKTTGEEGSAKLTLCTSQTKPVEITFTIKK
ncbi:MAG: glycoside hydrolase family 2 protein [Bacillus sp. (in: Bacteria)]|nr:glycoside hydrolase family 2 protein [Bacillus sp. (in: firmicutes)]MCM1426513.1 glycoside hydrolase family 2 protein [Eubacterium sp.]